MKIFKSIYLLIFIFTLSSCLKNEKIEYYENGNVKFKVTLKDSIYNGEYLEYYENGIVKTKMFFNNGKKDGKAEAYFENGNVKLSENWRHEMLVDTSKFYFSDGEIEQIIPYINGKKHGEITMYYNNKKIHCTTEYFNGDRVGKEKCFYITGNLQFIRYWILVNGKSLPNGIIYYNQNGTIDSLDHIVALDSDKDTINFEEKYKLNIKLKGSYYNNMRVLIGDFDKEYNLMDSNNTQCLVGKNNEANYTFKPTKIGINFIRGRIEDFDLRINSSGNKIKNLSYCYFEKKIYINDRRRP